MATKVSWIKADIQIRFHLNFIAGVKDAANWHGDDSAKTAVAAADSNLTLQANWYKKQRNDKHFHANAKHRIACSPSIFMTLQN